MQPIGQHIKILPLPFENKDGILERDPMAKALILEVSPDIDVPLEINETVVYFLSKQIVKQEGIYVDLQHCHMVISEA